LPKVAHCPKQLRWHLQAEDLGRHPDGSTLTPLPEPLNNKPERSGRGAGELAQPTTLKVAGCVQM